MLAEKVDLLRNSLLSKQVYQPFPTLDERNQWEQVFPDVKNAIIVQAEKYLSHNWSVLPADKYMDFKRNGNRSRYEILYMERRKILATLVVAECLEAKDRFIDDIINGIWLICEESSWVLPAHNRDYIMGNKDYFLPDIQEPTIDLFAAETGALLSWTHYLLETSLDKASELINERIRLEINRRILDPYLARSDYRWMGFELPPRGFVNNWNPWINSNCLTAYLLLDDDKERRLAGIEKILKSTDVFLDGYHLDGGCDEGPSYWNRAGGSLFDILEQLLMATKGEFNVYNEPLIQNIGKFIYRVKISDEYVVNFADGSAKPTYDAPIVYLYGKRIDDPKLASLGINEQLRHGEKGLVEKRQLSIFRILAGIFHYEEMLNFPRVSPYERDVFLDGIEVAVARTEGNSDRGLFFAAKGGHNEESHNHNDIGSFVVFKDGSPAIIDIGVETYTAKTFGPQRYEIWTMRSSYHNLPTINEYEQVPGRDRCASNVAYEANKDYVQFSLEIGNAYPKKAGIISWKRAYSFDRKEAIIHVVDDFELNKTSNVALTFMTPCDLDVSKKGIVDFLDEQGTVITLSYDKNLFTPMVEKITFEDAKLTPVWGNQLHRLQLQTKCLINNDRWEVVIK